MRRCAGAGLVLAGVGSLAWLRFDGQGPSGRSGPPSLPGLPDYTVPGTHGRMSIVAGTDRAETVRRGLAALGGVETFIGKGDRVLIKVNAAFASPPAIGATTHPDLLAALILLCLGAGAARVTVTDNPINDPRSCFALSGMEKAIGEAGGSLALPKADYFQPVTLAGSGLIRDWPLLYEPLRDVDKLIGVAPVKDHHRSGASMTLKNWYGLLGGPRGVFHQDVHALIRDLAILAKPTFVVLDGTTTMMTNGPTGGSLGDLKATGVMIVGTDPVAADAFGATLLGKSAADLPFIGMAAAAGAGTADFESLNPQRLSI